MARTDLKDSDGVKRAVEAYARQGVFHGLDVVLVTQMALQLWLTGKIIEPRAGGVYVTKVPATYTWMDLYPTVVPLTNSGTKEAWDQYRTMITLSEQVPEQPEGMDVPGHWASSRE